MPVIANFPKISVVVSPTIFFRSFHLYNLIWTSGVTVRGDDRPSKKRNFLRLLNAYPLTRGSHPKNAGEREYEERFGK